ncbi:hypothetical protein BH20ACT23_BH20ACT23_18020 [soil metagenome]
MRSSPGVGRRRGIAAAATAALAANGWDLLLTHWRPYNEKVPFPAGPNDPADLAEALESEGAGVALHEDDLADSQAPGRIMDAAEAAFGVGSVRGLVNTAAHSTTDDILSVTAESFDQHTRVNARGTLLLTQEFARRFEHDSGAGMS